MSQIDEAKDLLKHYFTLAGVRLDGDAAAEIEGIADAIMNGTVEKLRGDFAAAIQALKDDQAERIDRRLLAASPAMKGILTGLYSRHGGTIDSSHAKVTAREAVAFGDALLAVLAAPRTIETGYMCKIAFEAELGAGPAVRIFSSPEEVRRGHEHADKCGIVEVEVRLCRVVQEGTGETIPAEEPTAAPTREPSASP